MAKAARASRVMPPTKPRPVPRASIRRSIPPGYATSADFCAALLQNCQVLTIPGTAYGDAGEGWFRMSLTLKGADKLGQIREAIRRIGEKMPGLW